MHWRYQLNEWVVDHLDRMGHMKDSEVIRRSNLSQKRKTRNAIEVVTQMAQAGEIDKLWRDFHIALKSAREKTVRDPFLSMYIDVRLILVFVLVYVGMSADLLHSSNFIICHLATFTMIPHFLNSAVIEPFYISHEL